jgi:hypothetical protein
MLSLSRNDQEVNVTEVQSKTGLWGLRQGLGSWAYHGGLSKAQVYQELLEGSEQRSRHQLT